MTSEKCQVALYAIQWESVVVVVGGGHFCDVTEKYASAVDRLQLPILPEVVCTLYGLQGTTADPGLFAHWHMPVRMDAEVKWLLVYVPPLAESTERS